MTAGATWIAAVGTVWAAGGCQLHHLRPTVEETEDLSRVTQGPTARMLAPGESEFDRPCTTPRPWDRHVVYFANGTVSHLPGYFEDPFEDKGSENGRTEVTWEDWLSWPYSQGRWLINSWFVLPLSMPLEHPWTTKYSDGRAGTHRWREHDGSKSSAPDADGAPVEWDLLYENQVAD